ncbi:MAG: alpha/beta hydrolase [Bacteroidetes bacterium]|jgi:esterase/lipase|nr:alpha/beta hydrolase [Bacteroidota bacterium]
MKTIILLHGAIGAKDQFISLSNELKQEGFNVLTFNFSGHGQTAFQNQFGIEQFAKELEQFIKDNLLKKPSVFGHSMGGYVALCLASRHSDLIGNIITLGTKFEWNSEVLQKEVRTLKPEIIMEKQPKFGELLKRRHGNDWEALLQKTTEMMTNLGNKNALSLNDFASIENRVLIGLADKDNMVRLEETTAVYKQLKNGAMYMLPETKHPFESVNVGVLVKIISSFIN